MRIKKPRSRIVRILAAAVCALGVAVPVSTVVPATAAQAAVDCTPYLKGGDWYVNYGCKNVPIKASHTCAAIDHGATVNGIQAIQCANIYVTNDDTTDLPTNPNGDIWGEGAFYCQGPNGIVQCGGMNVEVGMSYAQFDMGSAGRGTTEPRRNYKCNPSPGPACPTGGNEAMVASYHPTYGNINTASCWQVYAWLPSGNVMAINGTALHSIDELDSPKTLVICFQEFASTLRSNR